MKTKKVFFFAIVFFVFLNAEIKYSHRGYFDLGTINRLSDGSMIKIPYRMLTYDPTISYKNFYMITSTALEFRLKEINNIWGSNFDFHLRELYLEWMTSIGEFSIGKQIISWGSASANNPTDNISPYNYYYLFSEGKEQKEGILAFNSTLYFNDLKLNAIFIPKHETNILPLNDSEFLISTPITPNDEQISMVENPYEFALSISIPTQLLDITTSYFSGYDRIMSFFGANVWTGQWSNPEAIKADTVLSFRHTDMFGLGLSTSLNDLSIKADLGYFITTDNASKGDSSLYRYFESGVEQIIQECHDYNLIAQNTPFLQEIENCNEDPAFNNSEAIDNSAKYYQLTFEIEYAPTFDFFMLGQITTSQLLEIGVADSINTSTGTIMFDPEEYFMPGMGAVNTFMSSTGNLLNSSSFSIIIQKKLPDVDLEFRYMGFYDLDNKGSINEFRMTYELTDNLEIMGAINKIRGNKTIENNQFSSMEAFSHVRLEVKYYY